MKILVLQTAFIGDVALSIPLLKNLRQMHPESKVTYYCRKGLRDFLLQTGLVDQVVEVDKKSRASISQSNKILFGEVWDWVICVHQSLRTKILLARLKTPQKTTYKGFGTQFIANDIVNRSLDLPEAMRSLELVKENSHALKTAFQNFLQTRDRIENHDVKLLPEAVANLRLKRSDVRLAVHRFRKVPEVLSMTLPRLAEIQKSRDHNLLSPRVREIMKNPKGKAIFAIAPGSVWKTKMWREEYFTELVAKLARESSVLLMGGPEERELCLSIARETENVHVIAGETTLWESAEIFACSDFAITNDSGAMHLASLSGVATLAIFGPTVLAQGYRPWNNQAQVIDVDLACRPCGKHGAQKCPLGTHACMKLLTPEQVLPVIHQHNPSH